MRTAAGGGAAVVLGVEWVLACTGKTGAVVVMEEDAATAERWVVEAAGAGSGGGSGSGSGSGSGLVVGSTAAIWVVSR